MDAKSKAIFINSVADGKEIACPSCGTINKADGKYCIACGKALAESPATEPKPAFTAVTEKKSTYVEPRSVFAQGLPEWSLEPPQVIVRRH